MTATGKGKREAGPLSPHLFHIRLGDVYVGVHLLEVLLGPVSLLAIPLKSPLALEAEESGGGRDRGDQEVPLSTGFHPNTPKGILAPSTAVS